MSLGKYKHRILLKFQCLVDFNKWANAVTSFSGHSFISYAHFNSNNSWAYSESETACRIAISMCDEDLPGLYSWWTASSGLPTSATILETVLATYDAMKPLWNSTIVAWLTRQMRFSTLLLWFCQKVDCVSNDSPSLSTGNRAHCKVRAQFTFLISVDSCCSLDKIPC